jgi:hypothetical protein
MALRQTAAAFAELGRPLEEAGPEQLLQTLTAVVIQRLAEAHSASITIYRDEKFSTLAATDELAARPTRCNTSSVPARASMPSSTTRSTTPPI